ncbi:MAG: hypothetical protein EOM76_10255 [Sphingobacteriia bacterium]|nr:hypothetical protein [Sphingobacteriia bacterium]
MKKKTSKLSIFFNRKEKRMQAEIAKMQTLKDILLEAFTQLREIQSPTKMQLGEGEGTTIQQRLYDWLRGYRQDTFEEGLAALELFRHNDELERDSDTRKVVTPKSVVEEIETVPNPINCQYLDEKIKVFEDKKSMASQRYVAAEIAAFIERLKNRMFYAEYHEFFEQFPYTTDEKIIQLLNNYKLQHGDIELFIPTLPKEAVNVMKQYTEMCMKLPSAKTPAYYIIATPEDFRKENARLDPILVVQSPFGFVWQILGAWDKEMLLLSEL